MGEKVIHEVRFIETDDGFRIEVRGDKERMRELGFGPGMMGFGPGPGFTRHMRRRMHRRHMWHCCCDEGPEDEEAPPADE